MQLNDIHSSESNSNGEVIVHIGEIAVSSHPDSVLLLLGLGSCVGVCAYDPESRIGGMAHVVLPFKSMLTGNLPAQSADVAIPSLIQSMLAKGAQRSRLKFAVAGGAHLINSSTSLNGIDIGNRNILAVNEIFGELGIEPSACDVGGLSGRTVRLHVANGIVTVRRTREKESVLVDFKQG